MIYYQNDSNFKIKFPKRIIKNWIYKIAEINSYSVGEVCYIFCSDERILEINQTYLQHDYFTDVITFDYTEGNTIAGDIFISLDTVSSNAIKYKVSFNQELVRVMIHGILHLCKVEDTTNKQKTIMRYKENMALDYLKIFLNFDYEVQI